MVEKRKNIDNFFKDYLTGHQVKAPENAWSRLQSELHPAPKRHLIYYTRLAAAAILLLIAFSAGYFYSEFHTPVQDEVAETNSPSLQENVENNQFSAPKTAENVVTINDKLFSTESDPEKKASPDKQQPVRVNENVAVAQNDPQLLVNENPKVESLETETNEKSIQEATALINPSEITQPTSTTKSEIQEKPELMTPEMLHNLLVGDDMANLITENEPDNEFTLWSVGGRITPVYSFRTVSGEGFKTPEDNVDEAYFNSTEQGITTIGGGISLSYYFSDNLSLASGLYVSRIGQANTDVVAYDDPNGFGGTYKLASSAGTVAINPHQFEMVMVEQPANVKDSIPGDYVVNGTFIQNMDYLEVPFVLNYKVLDRKISVNVNGGLSPGILVNNRSYFEIDGEKIQTGTTENLKPMIYNSLLGMSFEYSFSRNLIFSIEPTFKYSLTPINSNSGINYRPYSMSWFTGISYKL